MDSITDWISAISSAFTTLLSIGVLLVAYFQIKQVKIQLKGLADNQKNNTIMTVLELESELNKRKESFDKTNFDIRHYASDIGSKKKPDKQKLEILNDKKEVAKENYLNPLDRLSFCIVHNYISDRDWRTEYRDVIFEVVDNYKESFDVTSRFRSVKTLYERWKSE